MKILIFLMQIGDLFDGNFNWRGALQLFLFVLMGAVFVAFTGFVAYKAFRAKK